MISDQSEFDLGQTFRHIIKFYLTSIVSQLLTAEMICSNTSFHFGVLK